jgi:hypothetical protein
VADTRAGRALCVGWGLEGKFVTGNDLILWHLREGQRLGHHQNRWICFLRKVEGPRSTIQGPRANDQYSWAHAARQKAHGDGLLAKCL